jgi:hypothetical protein
LGYCHLMGIWGSKWYHQLVHWIFFADKQWRNWWLKVSLIAMDSLDDSDGLMPLVPHIAKAVVSRRNKAKQSGTAVLTMPQCYAGGNSQSVEVPKCIQLKARSFEHDLSMCLNRPRSWGPSILYHPQGVAMEISWLVVWNMNGSWLSHHIGIYWECHHPNWL